MHHLYVATVKKNRDEIYNSLRKNNIGKNVHYISIYNQPFYRENITKKKLFAAESCYSKDKRNL